MKTQATDTSIDAYHAHVGSGRARLQCDKIVNFIRKHGGNWSIGELAKAMQLEKSTISARVNECIYQLHTLVACDKRRDRISGITIRPVGLPPQAEMFQ